MAISSSSAVQAAKTELTPEVQSRPPAQAGLPTKLLVLTIGLVVMVWSLAIYQGNQEIKDAEADGRLQLSNLAQAFAEHSAKTLEGADQVARFVRREYLRFGPALDLPGYVKRQDVIDQAFNQIALIGADGWMKATSLTSHPVPLDLGDREHFIVQRDRATDRLFVSKPVLGRASGKWSLQVTRRVTDAAGRFAGVVVVSLSPDYLTSFYRQIDLGTYGVVSLVGEDGVVRARRAGEEIRVGQAVGSEPLFLVSRNQTGGTLWANSPIDGRRRLWAFRRLPDYDMVAYVGEGEQDILGEARGVRIRYLLGAAVISAMLMALGFSLVHRARQQGRLLAELAVSNAQAREASRLKSRFLASVSHELRTPLNGIIGYAELVQHTSHEAETREYGEIIQRSGEHLNALVNNILDLARIESGKLMLQWEDIALRPVLEELVRSHKADADAKGLDLTLAVAHDCPDTVRSDRMRLLQILGNILGNAIKFTESGCVVLHARSEHGKLAVSVTDTGPGIPPERREVVFLRFQAVTGELSHPSQGAGFGLPLAFELAQAMGGRLHLMPTAMGTKVAFTLPFDGQQPVSRSTASSSTGDLT